MQEQEIIKNRNVKPLIITITSIVLLIGIMAVAITIVLNSVWYNLNRGYKYLERKDYKEAVMSFNKVLDIEENNDSARAALIETKAELKELIEIDFENKNKYLEVLREINKRNSPTDAELIQKLSQNVNDSVLWKHIDDYDNDGLKEMFAFIATGYADNTRSYNPIADLWYISKSECRKINNGYEYGYVIRENVPGVLEANGNKIIYCIEEPIGDLYSDMWDLNTYTVRNESAVNVGRFFTNGNPLTQIDDNNFSVPAGLMQYAYLYFDGREFKEYGGGKIREDSLRRLDNASEILDTIRDSGYMIKEIYYRTNNIININCTKGEDKNKAITLRVDGKSVQLVDNKKLSPIESNGIVDLLKEPDYGVCYVPAAYESSYPEATYPTQAEMPAGLKLVGDGPIVTV